MKAYIETEGILRVNSLFLNELDEMIEVTTLKEKYINNKIYYIVREGADTQKVKNNILKVFKQNLEMDSRGQFAGLRYPIVYDVGDFTLNEIDLIASDKLNPFFKKHGYIYVWGNYIYNNSINLRELYRIYLIVSMSKLLINRYKPKREFDYDFLFYVISKYFVSKDIVSRCDISQNKISVKIPGYVDTLTICNYKDINSIETLIDNILTIKGRK